MSAARLLLILAILQGETNADKALTLHQIHDKLLRLYPEEDCTEQRIRGIFRCWKGSAKRGRFRCGWSRLWERTISAAIKSIIHTSG